MRKTLTCLMALLLLAGLGACEKADLTEGEENQNKPHTTIVDGNDDGSDTKEPDNHDSDDDNPDKDDTDDNNDSTDKDNDEPGKTRDGAEVNVAQFLRIDGHPMVYVTGYIVGSCQRSLKNADFEPPFEGHTAVLLADTPGEQNTDYMIAVHLKKGAMRDNLNLEDNPENFGRKIRVWGTKFTYLGLPGFPEGYIVGYELLE